MTKQFLGMAAAVLTAFGLASCSQNEDSTLNPSMLEDKDAVSYTLEMQLPDDFKTRAAAPLAKGSDGLYSFTREINKLWYAVYYEDQWKYDCTTAEAAQPSMTGDKFYLVFKLAKIYDPTKVKIFFWAGNAEDKVTVDYSQTDAEEGNINLNFKARCVSIDPKYVNGSNSSIAEYDSFCGYFQLSPTTNVSNFNLKFTLKRPFAQIHVLSDEFIDPMVRDAYPLGFVASLGFGRAAEGASATNMSSDVVVPTTWFYDNSIGLGDAYKAGEYKYTQTNYEYTNNLANTWPNRTTFKGRDFHYTACLLTFAPVDGILKGAQTTGNVGNYQYLNLAFRMPDKTYGDKTTMFRKVNLPATGIKANNRYVVYNHLTTPTDPNNPDGGGSGGNDLVSDVYNFEISNNSVWDGTGETKF